MHVCLRLLFASQKCKTFAVLLVPAELSHRSLIFAPRGGFAAVSFFIFFLSLEPPDAVFALHDFRVQIRWRKLAIPSLRSLPRHKPKERGHCPPQNTPSKSPKHHNILCFFFPRISLAVSPFPSLTAKYSQYRFYAVFPRFFPPFKLPVSVYISGYGLCLVMCYTKSIFILIFLLSPNFSDIHRCRRNIREVAYYLPKIRWRSYWDCHKAHK